MTTGGESTSSRSVEDTCEACRAALVRGQEWCHECGTARTLIHAPPDWRAPMLVVGTVIAAALAAFLIILSNIGDAAGTTSTVTVTATTARTASGAGAGAGLLGWPTGLPGWTVALAPASASRAHARSVAAQAAAQGIRAGLLDTSQHPNMRPGRWLAFTGRYPSAAAAAVQAGLLATRGYPEARATLVGRPGA